MFPGYVRSTADAVGYLDDWVRSMGGVRVSGINAVPVDGGGLLIDQFQVEFAGAYELTVSMVLTAGLSATRYSFNLQQADELVWRHDNHPGHEPQHGGPTHQHLGPSQNRRVSHMPVSLIEVAELIHQTLRSRG